MRLLLDTHPVLWSALHPHRLSKAAAAFAEDPANQLYFSVVRLREITTKRARGRADFVVDPVRLRRGLIENGYRELAVTADHAFGVGGLPALHGDPYDRMLLSQARVEGLRLLTSDAEVARYPGAVSGV